MSTQAAAPVVQRLGPLSHFAWSVVVGVVGALSAVVFRGLIALFHNLLFLGQWSVVYDANAHTPASPWGPFMILVPAVGAAGVAFVVGNHGVRHLAKARHCSFRWGHPRRFDQDSDVKDSGVSRHIVGRSRNCEPAAQYPVVIQQCTSLVRRSTPHDGQSAAEATVRRRSTCRAFSGSRDTFGTPRPL